MKEILITQLVSALMSLLTPQAMRSVADALLDAIEAAVQRSETKVDDAIVLRLTETIRAAFDIPDSD